MLDGSTTEVNEAHNSKAPIPMVVTDGGIVIYFRDLQPAKAPWPMVVTEGGIIIYSSDIHEPKTYSSINMTVEDTSAVVTSLR